MRNSAGPDDAPDTAPDQHVRPRHVAPLRTANDRTARLGLDRPPTTAEFHTRPLAAVALDPNRVTARAGNRSAQLIERERSLRRGKTLAELDAAFTDNGEAARQR